jgi:hypothetical protein
MVSANDAVPKQTKITTSQASGGQYRMALGVRHLGEGPLVTWSCARAKRGPSMPSTGLPFRFCGVLFIASIAPGVRF